jgi:hypothetical protein
VARKPINPGLLVTLGLPLFAILASGGTAVIAFTRGDPTLPDEYHWEGMSLDRDFADARHAAQLHVQATLQVVPSVGLCRVVLGLSSPPPAALTLNLIHATHPGLDQQVKLSRVGTVYEGHCGAVPAGHWHLELTDMKEGWSVRTDVAGPLDGAILNAGPRSDLRNLS